MIADTTMKPVIEIEAEDITGKTGTLQAMAKAFLTSGTKEKKETTGTIERDVPTPIDEADYLL
jgi:hypothetical protein